VVPRSRRRFVNRNRHDHREEHGVAWHLQGELHRRLQGDGQEPRHRSRPQPPRRRVVRALAEPAARLANEQADEDEDWNAQQQPSLGGQLQVVAVRLGIVVPQVVLLVEERGRRVRVQPRAGERKGGGDPPGGC
jgi:hypothetical protein